MIGSDRGSAEIRSRDANILETTVRLGFLGALLYWALIFVSPFLLIMVWSAVLAVALHPTFEILKTALGGRGSLAAAVITFVGLLVVIGPATWLAFGLLEGSTSLIHGFETGALTIPPPAASVRDWPLIGSSVYDFWRLASTNLRSVLADALPQLRFFGQTLLEALGGVGVGTMKFLISVVITGFLLNSSPRLHSAVNRLARRIDPGYGERFIEIAGATIRAVSRGVIGISLLQAAIAGIGLWLAGVPFASLLTLGVLVFGIVQVGPLPVAIPLLIWSWTMAPTLVAVGLSVCMAIVYLVESALKPFVLAQGLTTPTLVIFMGVIGGMIAQGVPGLFVGPIVLAVVWEFARAWTYQGASAEATIFRAEMDHRRS